jgi:NADP-dependent aldehyde dehydrogenase
VGIDGPAFDHFVARMETLMTGAATGTMLYPRILESYEAGTAHLSGLAGVRTVRAAAPADGGTAVARPTLFVTDAATFLAHPALRHEVFGPCTVLVRCASPGQMADVARALDGQLTVTLHGAPGELPAHGALVDILQQKAGRLVCDGFPTGVEVCASMQHGGPYPATTDARTTSVGTAAIERFVRPVAYQNFPAAALPAELQDANPRGIWRLVDGEPTRDGL